MSDQRAGTALGRGSLWGQLALAEHQTARAQLGRLRIEIHRSPNDWWVLTEELEGAEDLTALEAVERTASAWQVGDGAPPEVSARSDNRALEVRRLLVERGEVDIAPALADRSVIIRPTAQMTVPPHSKVRLFVGSPIWFEILVGDLVLYSRPVHRPSDTWFGNSFEGELCYSGRTQGRMRLENLHALPARAITRVDIENDAMQPFEFDRLSLPVTSLSLYQSRDWIWTDSVTLSKANEPQLAVLRVHPGPPEQAGEAQLLRKSRRTPSDGSPIRAFGSRALGALFG